MVCVIGVTGAEVYEVCCSSGIGNCFIIFVYNQIVYLRVSMDNVTCHWVRVSAMMDTLELTAAAKVDMLHYNVCRMCNHVLHAHAAGSNHSVRMANYYIVIVVCMHVCEFMHGDMYLYYLSAVVPMSISIILSSRPKFFEQQFCDHCSSFCECFVCHCLHTWNYVWSCCGDMCMA